MMDAIGVSECLFLLLFWFRQSANRPIAFRHLRQLSAREPRTPKRPLLSTFEVWGKREKPKKFGTKLLNLVWVVPVRSWYDAMDEQKM
jgi:hypothetical protein